MEIFNNYTSIIKERLDKVIIEEKDNIEKAAIILYKAEKNKNKIYFFGTGHSYIVGQEVFARAGGYCGFIPILENELCMNHAFKSTLIERMADYAGVIEELYPFNKGDVIVMTSNSGRNALLVELASRLKEKGLKIIVITSLEHSKNCTSRHDNGKLLYEFGDVVLDNKTDKGDAAISHNNHTKTGPTSTIMNCYIVHLLVSCFVELQISSGIEPKVFISSNVDEGDAQNTDLFKEYL
jgi:uncharacterized phosphosugar-binding protein